MSHMQQYEPEERKSKQRRRARIIETHFVGKGNPKHVIHRLVTTNEKEEGRVDIAYDILNTGA